MSPTRALVLLDCSRGAPAQELSALWERSGFAERLQRLGLGVCVWGDLHPLDGPWRRLSSAPALGQELRRTAADALVLVEPEQLFLDPGLVQAGLGAFDPGRIDCFTQWEHCRLPVGVGVRALAARTWFELGARSPQQAFARLRAEPAGRKFAYDVRQRVPFAESLLDARYGAGLGDLLRGAEVETWDLAGFSALVRRDASPAQLAALRYRPEGQAPRMDERKMPAAYGFESPECAEFPTYVMFDVTNVCNARCIHCPQSIREDDGSLPEFLRASEHQSLEVFKRVVDECSGHKMSFVRITADGEPLVHPHLFEMLEYARDQGVGPVGLTTNGSLLTERRAERLLSSGVALVDFSLDAVHPETFREIRVGLSFEKTHRNIERFIAMRNERGAGVKVVVSFVKQEANRGELEEFRSYWAPRVDEVVIREMISNVGLNEPSENLWPGWDARWPCAHFFRRVVINHQGRLKACPIDWEQRTANEYVADVGIFDQWHGDFYWTHRMQHLNDAIAQESACAACPDWAGTPWELGYEKIVERLVHSEEPL